MATAALSGTGSLTARGMTSGGSKAPSFATAFSSAIGSLVTAPGTPNGPGGTGGAAPSAAGAGWEIYVYSYANYANLLAVIPKTMLQSFQFTKQLGDLGSGTVVLSEDDSWWDTVLLPDGMAATEILDYECLWQIRQNGVPRFEFFGETVTEQLVDASEQRFVTVTGPGAISSLKRAMCAPLGFPNIILKLDAIQDSFSEVNTSGAGVIDTNIWNSITPASAVYITPVQGAYSYPGGAGYSLSTLYPSGSITLSAVSTTTFLGATPYDATDTLIGAQVSPIGMNSSTGIFSVVNLDGSQLTQFYIQSNKNPAYYAAFGLSGSAFYVQVSGPPNAMNGEPSVSVLTKVLPAYDPSKHAYWMITEQGGSGGGAGTFHFWTSPDGQSWTLQWSQVHNWDATSCAFYFTAKYDTDHAVTAQMSNLNTMVTAPSYQGEIYLGTPIMGIWYDQWAKAQARGTIPFTTTTISGQFDSFGNAWPDTQNVQTVNGTDLYSFLQSATSVLNADFIMQPGFLLQVALPEEGTLGIGTDRSNKIVFREGRSILGRQRVRQRDTIQNMIGAENQDGHEISAVDGTSVTAWGQREAWYQTGAQVDPESMAIAAAAAAAANADEITSDTLTITPNIAHATIFQDFDCGDWVGVERPDFSAVDADRVVAIAVSVDQDGVENHELTLTTYVQWMEQQLTFISNKLGGAFVNAPGLTPVAPSKYGAGQVPTYFTPAATLGNLADVVSTQAAGGGALTTSAMVYNPATGQYQAAGSVDPVSGNLVPLSVSGSGGAVTIDPNTGTVAVAASGAGVAPDGGGALPAGTQIVTSPNSTVVIVDGITRITTGLQGDGTVTKVDTNGPAPSIPDTPVVVGVPTGLAVTWDGLLGGAAPLLDFQEVQVHVSTTSGFTPSSVTLKGTLTTAGIFSVLNLTPGTLYNVKLVAVNTSGAQSTPSAQAAADAGFVLPAQISQLTASLLGNLGVLNPNPYFWGRDSTGWNAINGGTFAVTPTLPSGAPYTYGGYLSGTTGTNSWMGESTGSFPIVFSQQYLVTAWVWSPTGNVTIGFSWLNGSTVASSSTQTFSVPANTWTQVATVQTSPASGVTAAYPVLGPDAASSYIYAQAILCLPQVPGTLIEAGTITANQIAAGTIFAGIVDGTLISGATLEGGFIFGGLISGAAVEGGLISGSVIEGGIISGSVFDGTNFELNSSGLFFYAGTPGSGNLIASYTNSSGTDKYGNPYPAGDSIGQPGTGQVQLQPNVNLPFDIAAAVTGVFTALAQFYTGDSNQVFPGLVGSVLLGTGSAVKQSLGVISPFGTTAGAAMVLQSENDGGTDTAVITFGTVSSPDSVTVVFTPVMSLTPYALVLYSGSASQTIVTHTSSGSGTIPIPAGVTSGKAESWAASGGSGGSSSSRGGGGSGAAEYACEPALALTSGGTASYSIGSGGSAGSSTGTGGTGGNTTLTGSSLTVTAHGGHGGVGGGASSSPGTGGAGGTGSTNTIHYDGGAGGASASGTGGAGGGGSSGGTMSAGNPGNAGNSGNGGKGGAGGTGVAGGSSGGIGGDGFSGTAGFTGSSGNSPGGGSGGTGSGSSASGTAGAAGQVRLTYTTGIPAVGLYVNYGTSFTDQFGNTIPVGVSMVNAIDGNSYKVGHLLVAAASAQLINTTGYVSIASSNVGIANYRVSGHVIYTGTAAAGQPEFSFGGSATQGHARGWYTYGNSGLQVPIDGAISGYPGPALSTNESVFTFDFDLGFTSSGTFTIEAKEFTSGDSYTINSARLRVELV